MHRITSFFAVLMIAAITSAAAQPSTQPQKEQNMDTPEFRLSRVAMAVENIEPTVRFYEKVFNITFDSFEAMGQTLYTGKFLGLDFILVPNVMAGVEAKQSRHQFDVVVADMDAVLERVIEGGGTIREEERQEGIRSATVVDPDGNTMVLLKRE